MGINHNEKVARLQKKCYNTAMYKYETHCHTSTSSLCSRLTPDDVVSLYLKNGYTGVFVTDHFLNGNTTVRDFDSYARAVERFCEGYKQVKAAAAGRLDVFFGFEFSYRGSDILCYGIDCDALAALTDVHKLDLRAFCDLCRQRGALAVQAHPFREAHYIDHIRLYTNAEGVEVTNTARTDECNSLGLFYAQTLKKLQTCGSDVHVLDQPVLGGMSFESKLQSEADFVQRVRRGQGTLFTQPNAYAQGDE